MKSKPAVDCRSCGRGYKVDTFESCPHCGTVDTYGLIGGKKDFPEVCPHCKKRIIKSKPDKVPGEQAPGDDPAQADPAPGEEQAPQEPAPPVEPAPEEPAPEQPGPPAA